MKKIGIVTGIGKGLGLKLTKDLLNNDFHVIGINRSIPNELNNLKKFNSFEFYKCDISNFSGIKKIIDRVFKKYKKIDYLVNNAGIRARSSLQDADIKRYEEVLKINTLGPINISKQILDKIYLNSKTKQKFKIINISSIVGVRGFKDLSVYSCSKAALVSFTKSISLEYAERGLVINSVAPGFVKTSYYKKFITNKKLYKWTLDNIPMKRWGEESEIVELLLFLINSNTSYMNGSVITIDGGWTAK